MKIKLIKNRSDLGAGTRGADLGIDALEIAAINANNDYFNRYEFEDIATFNEAIYETIDTPRAKRIKHIRQHCERVAASVKNCLSDGDFPIVLAGDHSSALGTLSGIKAKYPEKRIAAIWIDAHADLHSPYTTPSGNVHGMPLAAALNDDNKQSQVNDITTKTQEEWNNFKNVGIKGAKVNADDVIFFGVRDTEQPEEDLMARCTIKNYTVNEVREKGIEVCVSDALQRLQNCDLIYISYDVDSMDCDLVSKGTGTPVSNGFTPEETENIMKKLFDSKKVVCLEVTEVNPTLDNKANKMAETAFDVLDKVTKHIEL